MFSLLVLICHLTPNLGTSLNAMLVWASTMPTLLLHWICEYFLLCASGHLKGIFLFLLLCCTFFAVFGVFFFFFLQKSLSFEKPIVYQNSQTLCLANWLTFLWLDFWSFLFDISYLHEIHDNDGLLMTFLGPYLNGLLRGLFEMIKYMIRHSSCLD